MFTYVVLAFIIGIPIIIGVAFYIDEKMTRQTLHED